MIAHISITMLQHPTYQVAKAPDGNGGLYAALETSGTLADMASRGVEALDVVCVDNILARVADPEFVGCCYARGSQLGARMLAKAYPEEKVGVFAQDEAGKLRVRGRKAERGGHLLHTMRLGGCG